MEGGKILVLFFFWRFVFYSGIKWSGIVGLFDMFERRYIKKNVWIILGWFERVIIIVL